MSTFGGRARSGGAVSGSWWPSTRRDGRYPSDWNRTLAQAGYVAPHWPAPWGLDADPTEQLSIDEVMRELGVPRPMNPIGVGLGGADAARRGDRTAATGVAARHPRRLRRSGASCSASPPRAATSRRSRPRAVRDGEEYVVNGQKVWTTLAHVAQFGILLARTDPDAPAQEGITYFVVDMRTPGIEVRPLVQMTGTHEFNEVFFTDVRVPAANVVGTEHDGWRLAKVTLGNERVSLSGEGALWGRGPTANDVIDLVRAHGGTTDRRLRQQLARLYTESEVLRLIRLRTLSARLRGLEPGPEASVRKAMSDEHGQHVMEMAKVLGGAHGMLTDRGPFGEPDAGMWNYGYLYARALTIGGGTSEVQRNILGEKVLGLPRE